MPVKLGEGLLSGLPPLGRTGCNQYKARRYDEGNAETGLDAHTETERISNARSRGVDTPFADAPEISLRLRDKPSRAEVTPRRSLAALCMTAVVFATWNSA